MGAIKLLLKAGLLFKHCTIMGTIKLLLKAGLIIETLHKNGNNQTAT